MIYSYLGALIVRPTQEHRKLYRDMTIVLLLSVSTISTDSFCLKYHLFDTLYETTQGNLHDKKIIEDCRYNVRKFFFRASRSFPALATCSTTLPLPTGSPSLLFPSSLAYALQPNAKFCPTACSSFLEGLLSWYVIWLELKLSKS